MSESKVLNLEDVQKNFMNDIKNQLDIKNKDVLHITFKKKKCNCPLCNHCFDYIHISDRVENLKISYDSEYQLDEILKSVKEFKRKN